MSANTYNTYTYMKKKSRFYFDSRKNNTKSNVNLNALSTIFILVGRYIFTSIQVITFLFTICLILYGICLSILICLGHELLISWEKYFQNFNLGTNDVIIDI